MMRNTLAALLLATVVAAPMAAHAQQWQGNGRPGASAAGGDGRSGQRGNGNRRNEAQSGASWQSGNRGNTIPPRGDWRPADRPRAGVTNNDRPWPPGVRPARPGRDTAGNVNGGRWPNGNRDNPGNGAGWNNGRWNEGTRRPDGDRPDWRWNDNRRTDQRWNDRWDGNRSSGNWNDRRWSDNRGNWNRGWRNDRRYDWQHYRNGNRYIYRVPRYYAPYNYGYRRWAHGYRLPPYYYGNSYWIGDPWHYRLPPPYGSYRWVRYYDDVLLVDITSGLIQDIIYSFFWR